MNKTWLPKLAGSLTIISGAFQIGIALYVIWPVIFGEAVIAGYWVPGPQISPIPVFYTSPWLSTGVVAILLGSIHIVRPKKWNLVLSGALAAFIPLGVIAIYYGVFHNPMWAIIVFVGIAAIILTILSRKQFEVIKK